MSSRCRAAERSRRLVFAFFFANSVLSLEFFTGKSAQALPFPLTIVVRLALSTHSSKKSLNGAVVSPT